LTVVVFVLFVLLKIQSLFIACCVYMYIKYQHTVGSPHAGILTNLSISVLLTVQNLENIGNHLKF